MNIVRTPIQKIIKRSSLKTRFVEMPVIKDITFNKETISFTLSDSRIITIPVAWSKKLEKSSKAVRENYIIRGHFVFWESIDEIIGVKNLIDGSIIPR
jgi:hypothetical protein